VFRTPGNFNIFGNGTPESLRTGKIVLVPPPKNLIVSMYNPESETVGCLKGGGDIIWGGVFGTRKWLR